MTQRHLEQLSPAACMQLLREQTVGRIVYVEPSGPCAIPVNFSLAGENVVFRIKQQSNLRDLLHDPVGFEVDHIDAETASGWSVLIQGTASVVPTGQVPELVKQMKEALPQPWAEGVHNVWVTLKTRHVTGRKLTDTYMTVR